MYCISPLILASLVLFPNAFAAIGPVTNLNIFNADISPDGFNRS